MPTMLAPEVLPPHRGWPPSFKEAWGPDVIMSQSAYCVVILINKNVSFGMVRLVPEMSFP